MISWSCNYLTRKATRTGSSDNTCCYSDICSWFHNAMWLQQLSGPRDDKAILLTQLMFQVFVIWRHTMVVYSSVLVAVTLIWAQLGDMILVLTALRLVMPLLGIVLTMFWLAFMAGVYLVVSNLCWLATFVLVVGVLFLYTVLILFIPVF